MSTIAGQVRSEPRRQPGFTVIALLASLLAVLLSGAVWSAVAGEGELALNLRAAGVGVAVLTALLAVVRGHQSSTRASSPASSPTAASYGAADPSTRSATRGFVLSL